MFCRSVDCYANQTYPNRELVIVNEGSKEYQNLISDYVRDRNDVKLIFLDGKYTLGALRNISIGLCDGDVFVQWDDDDFNARKRLSVQVAHLLKHPEARACYLTDQLHYYFNTKQLFWENWEKFLSNGIKEFSLIPGTIMAYKEGFRFTYPASGTHACAGEDSVLAHQLCKVSNRVVLLRGMGHLHVYSFHGKNVWDIEHHAVISKRRSESSSYMKQHKAKITESLDYFDFAPEVRVMGRDSESFIHRRKN